MTDEFLTKGLESDRYLKAVRLTEQFESEIEVKLRNIGDKMVAKNSELFDSDVKGSERTRQDPGTTFAFTRIDYPMDRIQSQEDNSSLRLNVHLYWSDPTEYNRADIDGAIRALGYKIKNVAEADEKRVMAQTGDGPIRVTENPFGSTKAFYRHVSSADEIKDAGEQLVDHFSEFGNEYGVPREEQT